MKLHLRIDRSRAILTLLALVIFTSPAFGALAITGGTAISCTLQTASPTSIPITVKLSAAPTGSVVIGATPSSNALVVTQATSGAAGNTLATSTVANTSTIWSTGVVFNVSAQAYCANATMGTNSLTVNFTGTGGLTGSQSITLTVTSASYTPTASSTAINLACNTANSSGSAAPQSLTIALPVAPPVNSSIVFSATSWNSAGSGTTQAAFPLLLTVPNTAQTPGAFAGITVGIDARPYCALSTVGTTAQTFALHATQTGGTTVTIPDTTITVTFTVTAGASPLTVSPSAISISCTYNGPGNYTVGQPQYVSVTGPVASSTVFSVNTNPATSSALAFAVLNPIASSVTGTAGVVPYNFTVAANATCGGKTTTGSFPGTIHLTNAPNQDKIINVTLNMVPASPLSATLSAPTLTYVKASGTPGYVDVLLTNTLPSPPNHFTVDTTSLPSWLTVDTTTGMTPRSIRFSSTSMADTMAPGTYSQDIRVQSPGSGDKLVTITMRVSNPPSSLSVSGTPTPGCPSITGPTQNCNWVIGQPLPNLYITLKSTDAPLAYSIATGGVLAPIVPTALLGGLAYNFGTTIPVTFSPSVVVGVAPGTMLSGTVSITSGNPATTYVVTFNITAQAPGAIVTGITPTIVPTLSFGQQVQLVVTGSGFVKSASQATTVGILSNGGTTFSTNTNIGVNVLNESNILLTITASNPVDPLLRFDTTGTFDVTIGVCNPIGGATCTTATGSATFTIGAKPIITTVTSASSYLRADNPPVAAYDMISIFGTNLCSTCVGSGAIMYGSPQSPNMTYPTSLTSLDGQQIPYTLQVAFKQHTAAPAGTAFTTVYAPLLFATNNQINLLVPSTIPSSGLIDMIVYFGPANGVLPSNTYTLTGAVSDPGLFTTAASGQGSGAILDKTYAVVGPANPVAMHATANSDPVMIYMTGLGAPNSGADNSLTTGSHRWSTDCIAPTGTNAYTGSLANATGVTATTLDGMILQSAVINTGNLVPCLDSTSQPPDVYIGGVKATVTYAGWVADSIAGLYQVNATVPKSGGSFYAAGSTCAIADNGAAIGAITAATELPICVVSKDGKYSQPGVTVAVAPRLFVSVPTDATGNPKYLLTEKVGAACASGSGHKVVALEGSGSGYTYALTTGTLPSGLSLASNGAISGVPAMGTVGTYPITVTATDSNTPPMTGTVSFVVQVGSGLFVTSSVSTTTGNGQIQATGGTGGYTFSMADGSPSLASVGLSMDNNGNVTGTATPGSTAQLVFKVTDGNGVTGTVTVTLAIPS